MCQVKSLDGMGTGSPFHTGYVDRKLRKNKTVGVALKEWHFLIKVYRSKKKTFVESNCSKLTKTEQKLD